MKKAVGILLLMLSAVYCTIDDLVNGITMPSVPIAQVLMNMGKPYIIEAVKGVIEEKYKTDPLKSVPR